MGLCEEMHMFFNKLERFSFPFNKSKIPLNGIYIMFEKGEKAHGVDRIVRVGTHTGIDQLFSRLNQHFVNENKDRSIFRKNVGRAILNKRKDSYIDVWEIDFTTSASRKLYQNIINPEKQRQIEKEVSDYMKKAFSFVVFRVDEKNERLKIESKIISTLSKCNGCKPTKEWLGNFSPKVKIKESGLWLVNELFKEELTEEDFLNLKNLVT